MWSLREVSNSSLGSVIYATLSSQLVNNKTTLIRGMHVNIEAGEANVLGVREGVDRKQKIPPVYMLSINETLGSLNHILRPQHLSCTGSGSMIDGSGVI